MYVYLDILDQIVNNYNVLMTVQETVYVIDQLENVHVMNFILAKIVVQDIKNVLMIAQETVYVTLKLENVNVLIILLEIIAQ